METHHYVKLLKHLKVDPKKIPLCIETGTHRGWGTEQWSKFFEKVITIELSEELFKFCLDTYELSNVEFLQGSSDKVLKDLIENITQPYFLFLDAHGSGGDTTYDKSVGRFGSPVIEEIKAIKNNLPQFIVIDDWNLFTELPSYPDPDIVKEEVSKVGDYSFSTYSCDIITGGVLVCERN